MLHAIAAAILAFHPQPLPLEGLTLERSRNLDKKRVFVSLLVSKPPFNWEGSTIVGASDRPDGVERTAVLVGKRIDVEGRRIVVAGKVRVIEHPSRWVGQELVLPWVEIRVDQER